MLSTNTRVVLAATATAATITLLAGCGNGVSGTNHSGSDGASHGATPSASASDGFNPQDAAFAGNMISHHRQALRMASIAPERDASPEVTALAAKIEAAQQPEIETMSGWLQAWGKEVPGEGMDHGAGPAMPGMMTAEQMDELNGETGAQFDKLFLEMMIEHHKGAITMAKAQQRGGSNPDAKALADKVIADQSAEIAMMQKLLQGM